MGEARGEGVVEVFPDRGKSSSFRRVSWGVGGVDDVAGWPKSEQMTQKNVGIIDLRDVLLCDDRPARGPLLQSLSAGESGGPGGGGISPRVLNEPNLRPGPSSSLGLNLLPIVHDSSLSAALSGAKDDEFLRRSGSGGGGARDERLERQSLEVSETDGAGAERSAGGPS